MNEQDYKPSKQEWNRIKQLPFLVRWEGNKRIVIHYEGRLRYRLDEDNMTVSFWETSSYID